MAAPMDMCEGAELTLILDPEKSTFLGNAPLYQSVDDPNTYYLDEALTVRVNLYTTVTEQEEKVYVVDEAPLPQNESFNREQTLFLIDLMRQHLKADGESQLRALQEVNPQVKSGKSRKKHMWRGMSTRLSKHFQQVFQPDHVARTWCALEDEYKKDKDEGRASSGEGPTCEFFQEMEELLGARHDVEFPVVGTVKGVEVRRPKTLNAEAERDSETTLTGPNLLKRRKADEHYFALLDFLKDSTAARQRRHDETLAQMKSSQNGFEALMNRFLNKL